MLRFLGVTPEDARARYGHMLDAFEFGAPPHGGFGHGLDRAHCTGRFASAHEANQEISYRLMVCAYCPIPDDGLLCA